MISAEFLLILCAFWAILLWTLAERGRRQKLFSRRAGQWAVDLFGLTLHGTGVPLFQTAVIFASLAWLAPGLRGSWEIPAPLAFFISFVGVDYAYYWNHRLLHTPALWRFHSVHHSGETFDVFTTSRNSALSTFLILYVWANGVFLFLLHDPAAYAWGVAVSNGLDILRHAGFERWPNVAPLNWIISPRDHAWHHSTELYGVNFGANFNLWDRIHGTYHESEKLPSRTGATLSGSLWSAFWKGAPNA